MTKEGYHTPPPWHVDITKDATGIVIHRRIENIEGILITSTNPTIMYNDAANARLLALAPELKEALQRCLKELPAGTAFNETKALLLKTVTCDYYYTTEVAGVGKTHCGQCPACLHALGLLHT